MPHTTTLPRRALRLGQLTLAATLLASSSPPAMARPVTAEVDAVLSCDDEVVVTVTEHAISNLVIVTDAGEVRLEDPFDGEELMTHTVDVAEMGEVTGVYVKAGNNGTRGKRNRGLGEYVQLDRDGCDATEPTDPPVFSFS